MKQRNVVIRILKTGYHEIFIWLDFMVSYVPGVVGTLIRRVCLKRRLKKSGSNVNIGIGVEMSGPENIQIGSHISIMKHSCLYANSEASITLGSHISINTNTCIGASNGGKITIGDYVLIAQNVVLRASDHKFENTEVPICDQGHTGGIISIGAGCWIGANSVITRNVKIGEHSIVAAGSVVTKDIEPFSVVGGVPAKLIRKRLR